MNGPLATVDLGRVDVSPRLVILGVVMGLMAAIAASASPLAVVGVGVAGVSILLLALGQNVVPLFQGALGILLFAYAFFNRGFAYLGAGGVYVSELVVAIALFAILARAWHIRFGIGQVAIGLYMIWGALQTIPYVGTHGIDAFRDAAAWGYAIIALAVSMTMTRGTFKTAVRWYGRLVPIIVIWLPFAAVVSAVYGDVLPTAPGSDVPIIFFKAGDAGVQLAGVAAFMLVGLFAPPYNRAVLTALTWVGWFVSLGLVAAMNRGGMLSAAMAGLSILLVRRLSAWVIAGCVGLALLAGGWLANPQVDLGLERSLSFQQVTENVASILGGGDPSDETQGTKEWRLTWWGDIVDYTVHGPYFWTGKGFGVNLADDDGFQVLADGSLRSPHSAHFEILARSGVPGLISWLLVQAAVWFLLLRSVRRAWQRRADWWLAVAAWLGVFWLANLVNMSFDVYLAGPMGGFWFWAIVGAILALDRVLGDPVDSGASPTAPSAVGPGIADPTATGAWLGHGTTAPGPRGSRPQAVSRDVV